MPSAADPKRSVRLAPEDLAMLETASQRCNIAVGALIRECVRRSASAVAADASAGRVTLRRRSAAASRAPSSAAPEMPSADETPRPSPAGRQAKSEAALRPARSAAASLQGASRPSVASRELPEGVPSINLREDRIAAERDAKSEIERALLLGPGVKTARELMLERQRKLNERRG